MSYDFEKGKQRVESILDLNAKTRSITEMLRVFYMFTMLRASKNALIGFGSPSSLAKLLLILAIFLG